MDLLIPGLYIWLPNFTIRIGGSIPDDQPYKYPGEIHSHAGIALVLLGYRIWTTYQGTYDPQQASDTGNTNVETLAARNIKHRAEGHPVLLKAREMSNPLGRVT